MADVVTIMIVSFFVLPNLGWIDLGAEINLYFFFSILMTSMAADSAGHYAMAAPGDWLTNK